MYDIEFLPQAENYFKKLKEKPLKEKYKNAIIDIRNNPSIGQAKVGDLAGIYGYDIYYNKTQY